MSKPKLQNQFWFWCIPTFIVIAVEYKNQKRYFLTVSFQELSILLHFLEPPVSVRDELH